MYLFHFSSNVPSMQVVFIRIILYKYTEIYKSMLARCSIHRNTLTIYHKKTLDRQKPSTDFVLANTGYLVRRFSDSLNIRPLFRRGSL